ncbi:hypothetical protein DV737_g3936, partial [Chaetothyriales sp. CBS 132003]
MQRILRWYILETVLIPLQRSLVVALQAFKLAAADVPSPICARMSDHGFGAIETFVKSSQLQKSANLVVKQFETNASSYLNNLLLARGLLANGNPIDFASTTKDNADTTQSQIINLVHDLILRRDRDFSQLESLSATIRQLRAEESQRLIDLQMVQDKNAELARELANSEAQQRALKASVKKAGAQAKELKDQAAKMKSMLDQVRAKCISDVRKRDIELEKLKGHLAGMQRRKKDASGMKINVLNPQAHQSWRQGQDAVDGVGNEWGLEKETNNFLTAIVNETSSENVALRNIVKNTMETQQDQLDESQGSIVACETLEQHMNAILEHCRTILRDPSFAPIEEVHLREAEIIKLRMGWEKMASRWKEAVTMMDNWRRRMLDGEERIDLDELSHLEFGESMAVLPDGQPVLEQDNELSCMLFDENRESEQDTSELEHGPGRADEMCPAGVEERREERADESDLDIPPEPHRKRLATSPARRGITLPRPTQPLGEIGLNTDSAAKAQSDSHSSSALSIDSGTGNLDGVTDENETFRSKARRRILHKAEPKQQPRSVAEKLAAVEAEAQEAEQERQRRLGSQKRKAKPARFKKAGRRRSTLSPEELAALMGAR